MAPSLLIDLFEMDEEHKYEHGVVMAKNELLVRMYDIILPVMLNVVGVEIIVVMINEKLQPAVLKIVHEVFDELSDEIDDLSKRNL